MRFQAVIIFVLINYCYGQIAQLCYSCRSRGKLGDCQDHFIAPNKTHKIKDVESVPCSSGWCTKTIDGDKYGEDHDLATERRCMLRPPPDLMPRCAEALYDHKKIFLCFCKGSLCNSATTGKLNMMFYGIPILTYAITRFIFM